MRNKRDMKNQIADEKGESSSEGSKTGSSSTEMDLQRQKLLKMELDSDADVILEVECGPNKALIHLGKLQMGSKGACVFFEDAWLTPNEFQFVSGRETAKDWKRSIKHFGKSLKLLMAKGFMSLSPPECHCEHCVETGPGKSEDGEKTSASLSSASTGPNSPDQGESQDSSFSSSSDTSDTDSFKARKRQRDPSPKSKSQKNPKKKKTSGEDVKRAEKSVPHLKLKRVDDSDEFVSSETKPNSDNPNSEAESGDSEEESAQTGNGGHLSAYDEDTDVDDAGAAGAQAAGTGAAVTGAGDSHVGDDVISSKPAVVAETSRGSEVSGSEVSGSEVSSKKGERDMPRLSPHDNPHIPEAVKNIVFGPPTAPTPPLPTISSPGATPGTTPVTSPGASPRSSPQPPSSPAQITETGDEQRAEGDLQTPRTAECREAEDLSDNKPSLEHEELPDITSPDTHRDTKYDDEDDDKEEVILSPNKEARLTSIINELRTYKKTLIKKIEITKDTCEETEGDTVTGPDSESLTEPSLGPVEKSTPSVPADITHRAAPATQLHAHPPKLDYYEKLKSHLSSRKDKHSSYPKDVYGKSQSDVKTDKYSQLSGSKNRERSLPKSSPVTDKHSPSNKKATTTSSSSSSTSLASSLTSYPGGLPGMAGMQYIPYPYMHPGLMPGSMTPTSLSSAALTSPMLYSSLYGLYPNLTASLGASGLSADSMAGLLSSASGLEAATSTSVSTAFAHPAKKEKSSKSGRSSEHHTPDKPAASHKRESSKTSHSERAKSGGHTPAQYPVSSTVDLSRKTEFAYDKDGALDLSGVQKRPAPTSISQPPAKRPASGSSRPEPGRDGRSNSRAPVRPDPRSDIPGRASASRHSDVRGSEGRGSEGRGSEGRGSEGRGSEGRVSESRGSEGRVSESRGSEGRVSESRRSEGRSSETRGSESRNTEMRAPSRESSRRTPTSQAGPATSQAGPATSQAGAMTSAASMQAAAAAMAASYPTGSPYAAAIAAGVSPAALGFLRHPMMYPFSMT